MRKIIYLTIGCFLGCASWLPAAAQKHTPPSSSKDSVRIASREALNRQRMENYVKLLEAHSLEEEEKKLFFVLPVVSYHPSQMAYGVMAGFIKRRGGYVKVKHSLRGHVKKSFECNDEGVLSDEDVKPWYNGKIAKNRWALTGGVLQQVGKPLYAYAGIGYGVRRLNWQTVEGAWVRNTDRSHQGIEVEIGGLFLYKRLAISLGAQTNSFQYLEGNLGVGIVF